MLCENCGKNHANVRYTQIINGVKKEISLCEECSKKLGIGDINFDMPIDFSSFLGDFMSDWDEDVFPALGTIKALECPNCKTSFEKIMNSGKIGCGECYETFHDRIDEILKNIHGANRHIGRIGKINSKNIELNEEESNNSQSGFESVPEQNLNNADEKSSKTSKIDELQMELKKAIKEERYEDAAKIRDKIKSENQK
ncbi:MAG: UvrB/UvrC motif-containing protein [Clostridia bacterium]|nr:UvrB/UvrC motif-containing protein [Clostridia bacterium]